MAGEASEDPPQKSQAGAELEGQVAEMLAARSFDPRGPSKDALAPPEPTVRISETSIPLTFEDVEILRATSIKTVLHRGATVLQDSSGTERTYLQSKVAKKIDVFVSHNWTVPRAKKFWALALHFNLAHAAAASYVGVALGCLLNALLAQPAFKNGEVVMRPYCLILGSLAFFLALAVGHEVPLMGRLFCRRRLFLDKVCIHQTDPALKAAGIKSLGAFLGHSDRMLVLFHTVYVERLWTVYELACFMYLHRRNKLDILPVGIPKVVLLSTAMLVILQCFIVVGVHLGTVLGGIGFAVRGIAVLILAGACLIPLTFLLRAWALQQVALFASLRSFQISEARCADESDRPVISSNICAFVRTMGLARDDASEAEALRSFDKLVQENLPGLLRSAVGRTGLPYKYAVLAGGSIAFYTMDVISSQPDAPASFVWAWLLYAFNMQAAVIPSSFLVSGWMCNRCPELGKWAELGFKVGTANLAVVVMMGLYLLSAFFRAKAQLAAWWLAPYAVLCAVETLVMAKLF